MLKPTELLKKLSAEYFSKRVLPYWVILLLDSLSVFISAVFIYWITYRSQITFEHHQDVFTTALCYGIISWIGARIFRTYSGVLRFSSFIDLMKVLYANLVNLGVALAISSLARWRAAYWLGSLTFMETVAAFLLATLMMWGLRILVKTLYDVTNSTSRGLRVLIYGALNGGVALAKSIRAEAPPKFELVGFITSEMRIRHMKLMGVRVFSRDEDDIAYIIRKEHVQGVLVSPFVAEEFRENQKIQDILIGAGCRIFMVSEAHEASFENGTLQLDEPSNVQLKEVSVEDLLPRSEIRVDMKSVGEQLAGKKVLITGAAGSIGSEIVRQVAQFGPDSLCLIDQAETPQHDIQLMMARDFPDVPCEIIVTSICHPKRMEHIFERFQPDYVFHAAAYKHVPMMEDNPCEAVMNNIWGTKILADLSVKYNVKKFVMISSDKAVNPTNVMGCSKRICEIYIQSLDRKIKLDTLENRRRRLAAPGERPGYTQFVTTRFGNVLGSNGSVIPLFREQIRKGGPVTVTDENIVRYFMLIPEACKLVLEAGTKGNGGEIFVFDMGKPVKIADLAKRMIALSGAKNIEIKYIGLREGEKLYEEVLNERENTKPTFHKKIRIAQVREYDYEAVSKEIDDLVEIAKQYDEMETVRKMKQIVPEYKSNNSVYEALDEELANNSGGGLKS